MSKRLSPISLAAALLSLLALSPSNAAALDLQLSNLRPGGAVQVELYADAESWQQGRNPVASRSFKAQAPRQTLRFDELPAGRYAVRVVQEPNSGGWLGREPLSFSVPRRGYSGQVPSARRPPAFERAAVRLDEAGAVLSVRAHLMAP